MDESFPRDSRYGVQPSSTQSDTPQSLPSFAKMSCSRICDIQSFRTKSGRDWRQGDSEGREGQEDFRAGQQKRGRALTPDRNRLWRVEMKEKGSCAEC